MSGSHLKASGSAGGYLLKSQVIINVQDLTVEEKARILYNHLKLGDQEADFRKSIKPILPAIAKREDFLPESARRLGTQIFTEKLIPTAVGIHDFFERPMEFLEQTIENLAAECRAAIALVFQHGGKVRSPVSSSILGEPANAFGVTSAQIRTQLEALNRSLLNLAEDEEGPFWTYRHPRIGDAFASSVAKSPELIEIYLRGAKAESIAHEVVCAGIHIAGASVVVPDSLQELLADRIANLPGHYLAGFISYRANQSFAKRLMKLRPDLWKRLDYFSRPLKDDIDVDLLTRLYQFGILSEKRREQFVEEVRSAATEDADDSFLEYEGIAIVLTENEIQSILDDVAVAVLDCVDKHVARLVRSWDNDYEPNDYFDAFRASVRRFADALSGRIDLDRLSRLMEHHIRSALGRMEENYVPDTHTVTPTQQSAAKADSLDALFRDVDD